MPVGFSRIFFRDHEFNSWNKDRSRDSVDVDWGSSIDALIGIDLRRNESRNNRELKEKKKRIVSKATEFFQLTPLNQFSSSLLFSLDNRFTIVIALCSTSSFIRIQLFRFQQGRLLLFLLFFFFSFLLNRRIEDLSKRDKRFRDKLDSKLFSSRRVRFVNHWRDSLYVIIKIYMYMMLHNFECKVGNFEESSRRISIELIYRENYFIDHNQETISHQRILKGQDGSREQHHWTCG